MYMIKLTIKTAKAINYKSTYYVQWAALSLSHGLVSFLLAHN